MDVSIHETRIYLKHHLLEVTPRDETLVHVDKD